MAEMLRFSYSFLTLFLVILAVYENFASSDCGVTVRNGSGIITSPSHPDRYISNLTCLWRIEELESSIIHLNIHSMSLEYHNSCAFDYITVYDGQDTSYPKLLGPTCGTSTHVIVSSSNQIAVEMKTDDSKEARGFNASYSYEECQHVYINGTADNPKVEGVYVVKTEAADKCNGKIAYHHHSGDASLHYTTDGGWSIGSEPCGTEKWLYKSGSKLFDGDPTIVWQEYDGTVMKDNSNISLVCVTGCVDVYITGTGRDGVYTRKSEKRCHSRNIYYNTESSSYLSYFSNNSHYYWYIGTNESCSNVDDAEMRAADNAHYPDYIVAYWDECEQTTGACVWKRNSDATIDCYITTTTPTTTPTTTTVTPEASTMTLENNDGGPYATEMSGLVIGIVLFIAIIVLMGVMIYKKKKRSNEVGPVQGEPESTQRLSTPVSGPGLLRGLTDIELDFRKAAERAQFPEDWSDMPHGKTQVVVTLLAADEAYKKVADRFVNSVDGTCPIQETRHTNIKIVQIQRIQNQNLYKQYVTERQHVSRFGKEHGSREDVEMTLYHGTSGASIDSINKGHFDRAYAGAANACIYGRGCYFAKYASYSTNIKYSPPDRDNKRYIYQCRVVVGDYTTLDHMSDEERSTVRGPPFRESAAPGETTRPYDSVVNNINNPTICSVFKDTKAYPEYLITFKM